MNHSIFAQFLLLVSFLSFLVFYFCGMRARKYIDPEKINPNERSLPGIFVSEKILNPTGLIWAKYRNLSVMIFGISALLQGIIIQLSEV